MKGKLRTAAALLLGASMMAGTALAANVSFKDVPSNHWAYSYVQKASGQGLVSGIGNGMYGVDQKLSTADFSTMVCSLLYPDAPNQYKGASSYWWYAYVEAAYQKGLLSGTTAGNRRAADGRWTATVVEAGMSRYDLAQIIYNASKKQGWTEPSDTQLLFTMAAIPDWSSIPANYQTAVLYSYAGGYLTGMDSKGTFGGKSTMTRGQASVVLCAMLDAQDKIDSPTYNNRSGKLVNGKDANEENAEDAVYDLKYEFYESDVWDTKREYTSARLGTGTGGQGFAYMISDRVFGALPVETQSDHSYVKPGDIIYFDDDDQYVVVTTVDGDDFDYVMCNGFGVITWRESGSLDDLGSRDKIYTRYEGEKSYGFSEDEVADLIDDFLHDEYDEGEECDVCEDGYQSDAFSRLTVFGDRAFAYYMSDYLFDDREVDTLYGDEVDIEDIRLGDVIYLDDEELYVVVTDVDTKQDEISYLFTNLYNKVKSGTIDFDELDKDDAIYTRYEGESSGSGSSSGKLTESKVKDQIDEFLDKKYEEGDEWDESYRSKVMSDNKSVSGSEAFAYYLSDYIFGDRDVSRSDIDEIAIGDVIELDETGDDDEWIYCVVTDVDNSKVYYVYAEYDEDDETYYITTDSQRLSSMDSNRDIVYTRY